MSERELLTYLAAEVEVPWEGATMQFVSYQQPDGRPAPSCPVISRETHLEGRALVEGIIERKTQA